MSVQPFTRFSKKNRWLIQLLVLSHLVWCCAVLGLWALGQLATGTSLYGSAIFVSLQLYAAAQLLLPALLLDPERRSRSFYLIWGGVLACLLWFFSRLSVPDIWWPPLAVLRSGLLLLIATLIGAALARYVRRLWELLPVCVVMSLADFASWAGGPTANFTRQIEQYYRQPVGPPPLVDIILIKLVVPGSAILVPVFGVSDWIMVVFFAMVARHHKINDNLLGPEGRTLARSGTFGRYLPVSVLALVGAVLLAQTSGRFVPVLPVIALVMLLWYGLRSLLSAHSTPGADH